MQVCRYAYFSSIGVLLLLTLSMTIDVSNATFVVHFACTDIFSVCKRWNLYSFYPSTLVHVHEVCVCWYHCLSLISPVWLCDFYIEVMVLSWWTFICFAVTSSVLVIDIVVQLIRFENSEGQRFMVFNWTSVGCISPLGALEFWAAFRGSCKW